MVQFREVEGTWAVESVETGFISFFTTYWLYFLGILFNLSVPYFAYL